VWGRSDAAPPHFKLIMHLPLKTLTWLGMGLFLLIILVPFWWIASMSFKTYEQIQFATSIYVPNPFTWENYAGLWTETRFPIWLRNSLITALVVTAITTVVASLGGYAVARLRFPGREAVASLILILYLIPPASVEVHVIHLDVGDHADRWLPEQERAVTLVGFGDEGLALAHPCPASRLVGISADHVGRIHPCALEDEGDHRGRRRLPVRACDRNLPTAGGRRGERLCACPHREPGATGLQQLLVGSRDRARDHHRIR